MKPLGVWAKSRETPTRPPSCRSHARAWLAWLRHVWPGKRFGFGLAFGTWPTPRLFGSFHVFFMCTGPYGQFEFGEMVPSTSLHFPGWKKQDFNLPHPSHPMTHAPTCTTSSLHIRLPRELQRRNHPTRRLRGRQAFRIACDRGGFAGGGFADVSRPCRPGKGHRMGNSGDV